MNAARTAADIRKPSIVLLLPPSSIAFTSIKCCIGKAYLPLIRIPFLLRFVKHFASIRQNLFVKRICMKGEKTAGIAALMENIINTLK